MPIHLLWGDDSAARDRAVAALSDKAIDPTWSSINLSRLDGNEAGQALQVERMPRCRQDLRRLH